MRVLNTVEDARKHMFNNLPKKRWNDTLDETLFQETMNHWRTNTLYLSKGITVNNFVFEEKPAMVLYNPFVVAGSGNKIGVSYLYIGQIIIFVDDYYMLLSENAKEFTIRHELAHIALNHYVLNAIRDLKKEYEADKYASDTLGIEISIAALEELKQYLHHQARIEISKRVKALQKGGEF